MADRFLLRRDTAANWATANPVLALGEPGYDETAGRWKMGDGVTAWTSLAYATDAVGSAAAAQAAAIAATSGQVTDAAVAAQVTSGTTTGAALRAALGRPVVTPVVMVGAALAVQKHTPVDATSGPVTMTLPTGQIAGASLSVEKTDATANAITISGSIRGSAGTETLTGQYESLVFVADSAGSWWVDAGHKTKTWMKANFASQARGNILELAARLPRELRPFTPNALSPVAVTVSESTTQTITTSYREFGGMSPQVTPLGSVPTLNVAGYVYSNSNAADGASMHYGFGLVGDTVEVSWRAKITGGNKYWIYVNGLPLSATDVTTTLTTTAAGFYYLKLVFPSQQLWDVRVYTIQMDLVSIRIPVAQALTPTAARPITIAAVSDSFGQAVADSDDLGVWGKLLADLLGCEELRACQAGTGFTKDGGGGSKSVFGSTARMDAIASGNPRLGIVVGGTNDNLADPTVLGTAVTAFFAGMATRLPQTPWIMVGPQGLNYTQTVASATYAAQAKAIRDAALASPNVLGHVDMIGHATTGVLPASWVNGGAINAGDLRVYQGAIYQAQNFTGASTMSSSGPDRNYYKLLSWLTGTGKVGATTGDGNRDLLLSNDGTHPTHLGQMNIAQRVAAEVIRIIRAAALSVQ